MLGMFFFRFVGEDTRPWIIGYVLKIVFFFRQSEGKYLCEAHTGKTSFQSVTLNADEHSKKEIFMDFIPNSEGKKRTLRRQKTPGKYPMGDCQALQLQLRK